MRASDADAVDETYRRFFPLLVAKCRRMVGERGEAQDIAQETFARLWRSGALFDHPAAVTAWLYRTSTRLVIDQQRRGLLRLSEALNDSIPARDDTPESQSAARAALRRVAADTPDDELEAVVLVRVDGLSHEEVAEVLGIGERTVRRRLSSFDARLARQSESLKGTQR